MFAFLLVFLSFLFYKLRFMCYKAQRRYFATLNYTEETGF